MSYLINSTEIYRVETEAQAASLIEEAKKDMRYELKKYSSQKKQRKQKGEIVEEYYLVTLVKSFNDEKEPYSGVEVKYIIDGEE